MNYPFLEYIEKQFNLRSNFKKFNTKNNFTNLNYIYSNIPMENDEPFCLNHSIRISFCDKIYPIEFIVLNDNTINQEQNNLPRAFIYIEDPKEICIKYKTKDNKLLSNLELIETFPNEDFFDLFKNKTIKEVKFFNYYLLDLKTKETYCFERQSGKTFIFPFSSLKEFENSNNSFKYHLSLEKLKSHKIYAYLEKFLDKSEELNDLLTNKKYLEEYVIPEEKQEKIYIVDKNNFLINEFVYHKDWLLKEEEFFSFDKNGNYISHEESVDYLILNKNFLISKENHIISDKNILTNILNVDRNRNFKHPISYPTLQEAQKALDELKQNQIHALKMEIDSIISNYENKLPKLLESLKKLEHL